MKALVLKQLKSDLVMEQRPDLQPGPAEVVVKVLAAALNHRDYWITQGQYAGIQLPIVLGSDGAGVVYTYGSEVRERFDNQEVIINPGWHWGDSELAQAKEFEILGLPHDGTFAEQVLVPAQYIHRKPLHLSTEAAAALPLAGVTAYRALFSRGRLQPGENVLVTGVGGGVATMAVQFAAAHGANVFVTSSAEEKISNAIELGAKAGFNYCEEGWHKKLLVESGGINLTIDGAGGSGYAKLIEIAAPAGRIVNYGGTAGVPDQLDVRKVFWKQLNLLGSTMGSESDFANMLQFVSDHQIKPALDSAFPLADGNAAIDRMRCAGQFGKIVLQMTETTS